MPEYAPDKAQLSAIIRKDVSEYIDKEAKARGWTRSKTTAQLLQEAVDARDWETTEVPAVPSK